MNEPEAIAALHDPLRRRLYDYVAAAGHEVGRAEAAEAVDVQRTLAAFHLDKLVEVGLLETAYRRLSGRSGPGAGRPAKVYRRAPGEHAMSVPARDYRTVATLLAGIVEDAGGDEALNAAARRHGRAVGAAARPAELGAVLAEQGYEPYPGAEEGTLRLRNCPFHAVSAEFPPLVCGMNLALLQGVLDGLGDTDLTARLDAEPGSAASSFILKTIQIDIETGKWSAGVMPEHHLAQFNLGRQVAPLEAPEMAEFRSLFEPINALADDAPGFVWRLTDDEGDDATGIRPYGDMVIINMSVWESREALWNFAYKSRHLELLRRRTEWFRRTVEARLVLWWIPVGHIPTVEEAMERLAILAKEGAGPSAFTFREPFDPVDPAEPFDPVEPSHTG